MVEMNNRYWQYYKEFRQEGLTPQKAIEKVHEILAFGEV
jgi:hypothetical protein